MILRGFLKKFIPAAIFALMIFSAVSAFSATDIFTRNLRFGMRGGDVRELQKILNRDIETRVSFSGPGSAGNETDYFGSATRSALIKFQEKYRKDILIPAGLTSGSGIFGLNTRAKIASLSQNNSAVVIPTDQNIFTVQSPNPSGQTNSGFPARIKIPAIGVDTTVEQTGITPDGAMDVPKGPTTVSWFNLGPKPGDTGSAVISGHYGWKNSIPAVFDDLYKLKKGDKIYIEDGSGKTSIFIVRELRRYGENDRAAEVFSSDDGKSHLNLVTCEGIWNKDSKSYSKRLVVFTDKEV